jgi:uncharacterized protein YndB with AHSA1/START domain
MAENIKVSDIMPAPPERLYAAWLDPHEHTKMTGGQATDEGDGRFTAWDGYITGHTVSAVPHSKIVQAWRTTEFPTSAPDSVLTILFEAADGGTKVTFVHDNIPDEQSDAYEQGWHEHYFTPMKAYFGSPMEQVREVGERITHAVEEVTEQFEAATEDAMHAVDKARANARKQAVKAVKAVKKVQKKASAQLKAVGKRVKAAFKKKPIAKTKPKAKAKAKAKAKPAPKKKAKVTAKKKKR